MSNTENTAAPDSKRKVADHFLLAADGSVTKRMEEAVGIRYVAVDKADAPFTFMFDGATPGSALTMLAIFGAKTKATNEASRVRNGEGGGADEQLSAIEEVFEQLTKGVWREKAEGGGGARIDRDKVAEALVSLLGDKAAGPAMIYAQRFVDGYEVKGKQLTGDEYFKFVWSNDDVKARYRKLTGKTGPALDTLA